MSSQSFLSGQAGLKGRIFFQFSFAFSGLSFVPTALQKETRSLGRWEKKAMGKDCNYGPLIRLHLALLFPLLIEGGASHDITSCPSFFYKS